MRAIAIAVCALLAVTAAAAASIEEGLLTEALHHHGLGGAPEVIEGQEERGLLELHLEGTGFHRRLRYSLQARRPGGSPGRRECRVALLQPLPAGVYADIYELQNAASRGHAPPVRLFGKVDVESIAANSEPTLLAVYANASSRESESAPEGARGVAVEASVALHARYPRAVWPHEGSHWADWLLSAEGRLQLAAPTVLLAWGEGGWEAASALDVSGPAPWTVPTGNLRQAGVVSAATTVVILSGAALVLRALLRTGSPRVKQL